MKKIILTLFILLAQTEALACIIIKEINDGSVIITPDGDPDSNMYHVRVPKEHDGAPLKYLVLSAKTEGNEIAVPLAVKSKNGETGSYFYLSSKWINVRISANYEGSKCSSLVADLNM